MTWLVFLIAVSLALGLNARLEERRKHAILLAVIALTLGVVYAGFAGSG